MSRKKKPSLHPIAQANEDVFAAGHTPRIQVDARRADVKVPEHVRERWQARLVIDLDPSWPLALEHGPEALCVTLAFQGVEARCEFGWGAIYVVLDRATGRGLVIEPQLPPHELDPAIAFGAAGPAQRGAQERPTLVPVEPPAPGPKPRRRAPKKAPPAPAAAPTTDEEAKQRRARFRVIQGGG
jgi:stringent starvation protein B